MEGLSSQEIALIVNRFIGVKDGYLGDFHRGSLKSFLAEHGNLDIDIDRYEGTTRQRFIQILQESAPETQARVLRGIIERFPLGAEGSPVSRTQELAFRLNRVADRLDGNVYVGSPDLGSASKVVEEALFDVQSALSAGRPLSGVDRVHTAMHGYLRLACEAAGIAFSQEDGMTRLLKSLRSNHPRLKNLGPRSEDIGKVLFSFSTVLDVLNPIRNTASVAHPNENLLEKDEAILVINATRTLLQYLNAKLS